MRVCRVARWSKILRKESALSASPATLSTLEVVVSDLHKPLLLSNEAFVPYLCVTSHAR
jgi:hypothetical protein